MGERQRGIRDPGIAGISDKIDAMQASTDRLAEAIENLTSVMNTVAENIQTLPSTHLCGDKDPPESRMQVENADLRRKIDNPTVDKAILDEIPPFEISKLKGIGT